MLLRPGRRRATLRRRLTENSRNQFDNIVARAPLRFLRGQAAETIKLHTRSLSLSLSLATRLRYSWDVSRRRNRFSFSVFEAAGEHERRANTER